MKGVTRHHRQQAAYPQGVIVFEIDRYTAEYKGVPHRSLGPFGRRKFENVLFALAANERLPVKYIYH